MLDKYTKASLLQTMLGQDKHMSEYNIFSKALFLAQAGGVGRLSRRAELALDALLETYDEDELVEYVEMLNSKVFILLEAMPARLGKLKENYNKQVANEISFMDEA